MKLREPYSNWCLGKGKLTFILQSWKNRNYTYIVILIKIKNVTDLKVELL